MIWVFSMIFYLKRNLTVFLQILNDHFLLEFIFLNRLKIGKISPLFEIEDSARLLKIPILAFADDFLPKSEAIPASSPENISKSDEQKIFNIFLFLENNFLKKKLKNFWKNGKKISNKKFQIFFFSLEIDFLCLLIAYKV